MKERRSKPKDGTYSEKTERWRMALTFVTVWATLAALIYLNANAGAYFIAGIVQFIIPLVSKMISK